MTRRGRHILGSLQSRFLAIYLIVMAPIAILASYYQFTLAENRYSTREKTTMDSVERAFVDVTSTLEQSKLLMDLIAAAAEREIPTPDRCSLLSEATDNAPFTIMAAGVMSESSSDSCIPVGNLDEVDLGDTSALGSQDVAVFEHNHHLTLKRAVGERVVFLVFNPGDAELPDWVMGYGFLAEGSPDTDRTYRTLLKNAPWMKDPKARGIVENTAGEHILILPQTALGVRAFATLSPEVLTPSVATLILRASFAPFVLLAVALLIADFLVRRVVLRDINLLSREMHGFLQDRNLPQTELTPSVTTETANMRAEFSSLAQQLLREEADAENRIHNANALQREIFHRVGNNLQVIQSIMRLQSSNTKTPQEAALIRSVSVRLRIISLVHEVLHRTVDAPVLPVGPGIGQMIQKMRREAILSDRIEISETYDDLQLGVNRAYTLCYLIAETLVRLSTAGASEVRIAVDTDVDHARLRITAMQISDEPSDPVGLRLCDVYARGLRAKTSWTSQGDETHYEASFPISIKKAD